MEDREFGEKKEHELDAPLRPAKDDNHLSPTASESASLWPVSPTSTPPTTFRALRRRRSDIGEPISPRGPPRAVQLPEETCQALGVLRIGDEADSEVARRAVDWFTAYTLLTRADSVSSSRMDFKEFGAAVEIVSQLRSARYRDHVATAVCCAIFNENSELHMSEAFDCFQQRNGFVDLMDLRPVLRIAGRGLSEERLNNLLESVDPDNTEKVDLAEFSFLLHCMHPNYIDGIDDTIHAVRNRLRKHTAPVGEVVRSLTTGAGATFFALGAALTADLPGLDPMEMRKAGIVINNMREAGYSDEMITAVCRALFIDQSDANMAQAFQFYDKDGSGFLDTCEFRDALPLMGEEVSQKTVDKLFAMVDKKNTGKLDIHAFATLVRHMNPKSQEGEEGVADREEKAPAENDGGEHEHLSDQFLGAFRGKKKK